MRITESQIRKVIRNVLAEQADQVALGATSSPDYMAKAQARQELMSKFRADRKAAMNEPVTRGTGMTPAEKAKANANGENLQALAEDLVTTIEPAYDEIKIQMDAAYKAKDTATFQALHRQLQSLISKMDISRKAQKSQMRMNLFKSDYMMQNELIKSLKKILSVRDQAEAWLKKQSMSPEEIERSRQASERMKARWAGI